jgi:predicted transcriptional regulator
VWKGLHYQLPPKLWQLVKALWNHDTRLEREVIEEVWSDDKVEDSTIKSCLSRLSEALTGFGVKRAWNRKNGYFVRQIFE